MKPGRNQGSECADQWITMGGICDAYEQRDMSGEVVEGW